MKLPLFTSISALLLMLLLVGCATSTSATSSSSSSPAATANSRPACQGLATINSGLASLSNAGSNVTVGQLKAIQSGISAALNVVDKLVPAGANASATLDQLKSANDQLGQTLAGLPNGDTLGQHGPQLQQFKDQVAKAQTAASQLATKLNCSA